MKRFLWATDLHLNFLNRYSIINFLLSIHRANVDGVFITGDISTGDKIVEHLSWMENIVKKPIYFTLGNHDFFNSNFSDVKLEIKKLCKKNQQLNYLTNINNHISLTKDIALIGHDGWYDSRWREPLTSLVFMWDWFFIKDFRSLVSNYNRMNLVRNLADEAAESIGNKLKSALVEHSTVYLLTHFPPWPEKHYLFGEIAKNFWAPYNSSMVLANTLKSIMDNHPSKNLIVFSGHVHVKRNEMITPNIQLRVGGGAHGKAMIEDILIIPD